MEALNRLPDNSDNCLARKTRYEPCLSVSSTYITILCYTLPIPSRVTTTLLDFIDSEDKIEVSCIDCIPLNLTVKTNEMSFRTRMAMFTTTFLVFVAYVLKLIIFFKMYQQ